MKKTALSVISLSTLLLASCSFFGGEGAAAIKYGNENLSSLPSESIPEFVNQEESQTYYTSEDILMSLECNGYFTNYSYFYLDEDDKNLRVYDNMYFYEKDYFYFVTKDVKYLWASLEEGYDKTCVEEEKEAGYDIRINVLKDGIYTIKFNIETKKASVIYKSEITEPKYFPIKTADLYNGKTKSYISMTQSASNPDELECKGVEFDVSKGCSIVDTTTHISMYKLTIDSSSKDLALYTSLERDKSFYSTFDGKMNLYLNKKTYVLRGEIADKEHSTFYVQNIGNSRLTDPVVDTSHPYIFTCQYTTAQYVTEVPDLYGKHVNKLPFTYSSETIELYEYEYKGEPRSYYRFKEEGTYNITLDLSTLTFTAVKATA